LEDDPGPGVAWLLAWGDAVDTIVLIASLILVIVTVAAGTAVRTFRWPRLEKLVGSGQCIERIERLLKNEKAILDGLLVLRLVTSITLLLALIGWFGESPGVTGGGFLGNLGLSLLVFLGGVYGLVRGLVRHAPERALLLLLTPAKVLAAAMSPLVWIMDGIGKVVARAFGLQANEDEQEEAVEDILDAVSEGERDGAIDDEEREMIENIIEVRDQAVSQVMTPRTSVFGLAADTTLEDAVGAVVEHGHSRIPVYEETIDNIQGILYAKDLLRHWTNGDGASTTTADQIMRPALFIPETKNTSDLLEELRRSKVHMAIVVDEYGGTAGIITIEDIIEEIIGEIEDEYDIAEDAAKPLLTIISERESAEVGALVHIDELNDALHLELPEGDGYDTVGGFIFHRMGRIPEVGESCEFEDVRFEILEADERRIHSVKVTVGG
jgi:CBS domain containing-hemolysin-like protein